MRLERVYADRGFWYAEGLSDGANKRLRADRILKVEPIESQEAIEPLPYTHPSHPRVVVKLTARGARNVERDPHLGPALGGKPPTALEFHCPPSELDWYAKYFGSMGEDAVVQGPQELLEKIKVWINEIQKVYKI
jgi:predicted DNA-binding transcriptional regulator YafY